MGKTTKIVIIADDGGGITLQYYGRVKYRHAYEDGKRVIENLIAIAEGENPENWDGNKYEETGFEKYDPEIESNSGYIWYEGTARRLLQEFASINPGWAWGKNVAEMATAARKKTAKEEKK